ncbi:MAG: DUF1616 domain-containing protein [Anaerolineaceae bacterium]|nr:DUF1616 domain-containing protein [Anaerolineaceae bacterium]
MPVDLLLALLGALALLPLVLLDVSGPGNPLGALRVLLGLAYVLFVPGYLLQLALFPRAAELNGITRLALSFGLSIALLPPIVLLLNVLPWGIRPGPILAAGYALLAGLLPAAWLRRSRLPLEQGYTPRIQLGLRQAWEQAGRGGRLLGIALGIAFLTAILSGLAMALLPNPGDQFTEFYLLGSQGLAEDYPRTAYAGQAATVTIGVANHEGRPMQYRIVVKSGEDIAGGTDLFTMADQAVVEGPIAFLLPQAGDDQEVVFELYRQDRGTPYRSLRLWVDVEPPLD